MDIQWYPGHMTKALRKMQESIRLVDLIIELADARLPKSSRNPQLDQIGQGKSRILILNKADLADEAETQKWVDALQKEGLHVVCADARNTKVKERVRSLMEGALKEREEKNKRKGILNRPLRSMVVGIPNVGKSTFINAYAGRSAAKTGNTPGVTRGEQWISLSKSLELLDTPGLLWPKLEDKRGALYLALVGTIRREVVDNRELSKELVLFLQERFAGRLGERYGIEEAGTPEEVLERIAEKKGCLLKGGALDLERSAGMLMEDFRKGALGRMTLELCEEKGPAGSEKEEHEEDG